MLICSVDKLDLLLITSRQKIDLRFCFLNKIASYKTYLEPSKKIISFLQRHIKHDSTLINNKFTLSY